MRISDKYRIHKVADEDLILVQGKNPGDLTTVIALNESSLFLWHSIYGRDFEVDDVAAALLSRYDVPLAVASADAAKWVDTLRQHNIIV